MASSGKKKTTMAKLARESKLRERRIEKKARKEARKLAPEPELDPYAPGNGLEELVQGLDVPTSAESDTPETEQRALETVPRPADA
jgi:hypothetical protein